MIALDDFVYDERWMPLLEIANYVKIDVLSLSPEETVEHIGIVKQYAAKPLAEKVETAEQLESLKTLGFEYFQGFFLSKPQIVSGKRLTSNQVATLRLLSGLQDPATSAKKIETLVSQDISLSYKMLRYLNSAYVGLPRKVDSLQQAVVYLGLDLLRRWGMLLVMASCSAKPSELMHLALVRARMCELLGKTAKRTDLTAHFTVGLFSILDALMDTPMDELLRELPLADELSFALLDQSGPLGEALRCTLAYESCDWSSTVYPGLGTARLREIYTQAVRWSNEATGSLG